MHEWLERHPNAQETEFECRLNDLAGIDKRWRNTIRIKFKGALEGELKELLALVRAIFELILFSRDASSDLSHQGYDFVPFYTSVNITIQDDMLCTFFTLFVVSI